MTSAIPYWVASCFLAVGSIVGATAATSCSNSARVTTVLQSAGLDLSAAVLSHNPGIVITAAPGATVAATVLTRAAGDAAAALGGAGGAAGFAPCAQPPVAKNIKTIHPQ